MKKSWRCLGGGNFRQIIQLQMHGSLSGSESIQEFLKRKLNYHGLPFGRGNVADVTMISTEANMISHVIMRAHAMDTTYRSVVSG
jgi:hypothetical protein